MKKALFIFLLCFTTKGFSQTNSNNDVGTLAVLIQTGVGSGSGFYLQDTSKGFIYLVTACHVIINSQQKILNSDSVLFISYKKNSQRDNRDSFKISLLSASKTGMLSYDIQKDVAVIKFAILKNKVVTYLPCVRKISATNTRLNALATIQIKKVKELITMSDVYTIGYPKSLSLSLNFDYNRPLVRKGIISGIDLNKNKIITDCPVYQGNSGGMVFESNLISGEILLIGIVSQFVPLEEHWISEVYGYANTNIYNSGYTVVVPVDVVIDLINLIRN